MHQSGDFWKNSVLPVPIKHGSLAASTQMMAKELWQLAWIIFWSNTQGKKLMKAARASDWQRRMSVKVPVPRSGEAVLRGAPVVGALTAGAGARHPGFVDSAHRRGRRVRDDAIPIALRFCLSVRLEPCERCPRGCVGTTGSAPLGAGLSERGTQPRLPPEFRHTAAHIPSPVINPHGSAMLQRAKGHRSCQRQGSPSAEPGSLHVVHQAGAAEEDVVGCQAIRQHAVHGAPGAGHGVDAAADRVDAVA